MKEICFLVPAHNEEIVIAETLQSLLDIASKEDIYVVDDGSIDLTSQVAIKYTPNVLVLNPNAGKANAMNMAISNFGLSKKYKYIMPMDADTIVTKGFLNNTLPILDRDIDNKIACVVGKVNGKRHNWVTMYRMWEYEIAQTIHKSAQNSSNSIIVCPGCATVYRLSLFDRIQIPSGTLTEDMDLTFAIHRSKLGKIVFTNKASVNTQDPNNIKDFIKQIDRWYTGFWQCLVKHNIPWQGQTLDLEVALLALDGLFNGILVIGLFFLIPFALFKEPRLLMYPFLLDFFLFMIPTLLLVMIKNKMKRIFIYIPHFYLVRMLSGIVFLISFFKIVLNFDANMKWGKANRYQIQ